MHFSLMDSNAKPLVEAGRFFGHLESKDDKIEASILFKDFSGKEIDESSYYIKINSSDSKDENRNENRARS